MGIPKSDLLHSWTRTARLTHVGVTVALIHVAGQSLAV